MKVLRYEAVTSRGDRIGGTFFGSTSELIEELKQKGAFLVRVKEEKEQLKGGKYRFADLVGDFESLSYLVSSGMKLDKAVSLLAKMARKRSSKLFWEKVLSGLREGKQFSAAVRDSAKEAGISLSELYTNILAVGEEVGNIGGAISRVLKHMEFRRDLIREVKSSLSYPIFLLLMSFLVVLFTVVFIIPKFSSIFSDEDIEKLPAISKFVIVSGTYLNSHLPLVAFTLLSLFILVAFVIVSGKLSSINKFLYRLPLIRGVAIQLDISNLFSSLGAMLKGGVNIVKAVRMTAKVVSFEGFKNMLSEVEEELKKGGRMSRVLERYAFIPEDVASIVAAAESSANLDDACLNLGSRYLNNFRASVSRLMVLFEPAVIVLLGVFIGFIVVAIMLAVVSLTNVAG